MDTRKLRRRGQRLQLWSVATGLSGLPAGGIYPLSSRVVPMGDSFLVRGHHFVRRWIRRPVGWVPTDWQHVRHA